MKTEERHRLKTNSLAAGLEHFWRGLWDGTNSTTVYVAGLAVLIGVGVVVGWYIYSSIATESRSKLWVGVENATNLDDMDPQDKIAPAKQLEFVTGNLSKLAKDNPGTMAARVARFEEARLQLHNALERLGGALTGVDPEALDMLKKAGELYDQLSKESAGIPILEQEALMGAAKSHEAVGNLDGARPFYEKLANAKPESEVTKRAKAFLDSLADKENGPKIVALYNKIKVDLEKNAPPPK